MADATYDQPLRILGEAYTEKFNVDSAAARQIWKGEPVVINASIGTPLVTPGDLEALVDGDVFMGIAAGSFSNATGDSEDSPSSKVELYVEPTIVGFKSAVFTDADCGKAVWMSDTTTLTAVGGAYSRIGKLHRVLDGYAYVRLETPFVIDVP